MKCILLPLKAITASIISSSVSLFIFFELNSNNSIGFLIILVHLLYKIKDDIFSKEGLLAIAFAFVSLIFHDLMRESSFIIYFSVVALIISIIKGAPIFIILSGFGILFFWYDMGT